MVQMSILVTGGAGFIGSHLCEQLIEDGHKVVAIDNLSTGRIENVYHLRNHSSFQFVKENILNQQVLEDYARDSDVIVHLAAAVGVKLIVEDPVHTINTNVMGTEAILKIANRYNCKTILASSSEVYGKSNNVPFQEDDDCLIGPTTNSRWAYATSKAVDEFLGLAYFHQYNLPVIVIRLFNTIGPRQIGRYGMVVPRFVRQALSGEPLQVYGEGTQTRCFADVNDVVSAIIKLLQHDQAYGQVFNIGSTEEISIISLAQRVIQLTGSRSSIEFLSYDDAYAPGFEDMKRRVPSTEKLYRYIKLKPRYNLDDTLIRVIQYVQQQSKDQ